MFACHRCSQLPASHSTVPHHGHTDGGPPPPLGRCGGPDMSPPSPAPLVIVNGCPVVTRCTLPPAAPANNGELSDDSDTLLNAWAVCAAKVDQVYEHNQRNAQP